MALFPAAAGVPALRRLPELGAKLSGVWESDAWRITAASAAQAMIRAAEGAMPRKGIQSATVMRNKIFPNVFIAPA
jgi:hypothetical protein